MVIFKFITSDFEFDVILNIDDCTFSYNPLIKSVECRIERGKAEIQVFLWKEWKYIVDMYSRCHAVNDVTQGAAYLLLNKTGADRNRVWDFRGIHILGITHTETDKDRDPLRLTVILNARVIHPNFFWSLIDKKLHEVLLKPCSSQRFNTTIQGWSYTSTCYLNFTDDFTFLTRAKFVRVTVFDNDTSIIASTTSKSIHKFLAPWTIYAEYQPNTTVTCSFNESNQQNMKIQLTFMTSKWKYHVVISTDLCTLDPTPFIKDIQCCTDGGIFNIFVDLWEDLKYRDDIYVRCHDASEVIRGSIYIPIHDKHLRDEERHRFLGVTNGVSESIVVITFTICVLATIVDTLIMAKILLEKCEGRLSKHHEEEDVYSTITSCRQSSDSLQVHEHILPHLAIGHQNMES